MKYIKDLQKNKWMMVRHALTAPFIYGQIIPAVILDICAETYHRICFPLYGLEHVKRSRYIKIDRQKLQYLNAWEKIDCAYCGYVNGLLHYCSEIGARTEAYWCGIRHGDDPDFIDPAHHEDFLPYDDEKAFKKFLKK